ncbi:MAG: RNA-binding S4 domain-containing protein [Eubacterium sp.]|jgi:ribosome-associated protein|nr:RNA-binding S4 domain-containing protein [Eubacterium sp.]
MEIQIRENETFIRLGQALKKAGLVSSGIEAKMVILDGLVTVNEETETRRGRKLYSGDAISFGNEIIKIKK